jgi:hypothetical protein
MKVLIFRTDIRTKKKVKSLKPLFNNHSTIANWYIDLEDKDKVLKIEAEGNLQENEVIDLVKEHGFSCEVLTD